MKCAVRLCVENASIHLAQSRILLSRTAHTRFAWSTAMWFPAALQKLLVSIIQAEERFHVHVAARILNALGGECYSASAFSPVDFIL